MDHYIDVVGHAEYRETVTVFRADLDISVRAAKDDTAMAEVAELRQHCLRALLAAGIRTEEMSEGGGQAWQPWYWRKKEKTGQEASLRVLLAVDDMARLQRGLAALEPLFESVRRTLNVGMRQPEFTAPDGARAAAEQAAIAAARARAEALATAAGVKIAGAAQVEEISALHGRSGMHGDEAWRGPVAFAASARGLAEEAPEITLDAPTRTIGVRFRVRFAIAP